MKKYYVIKNLINNKYVDHNFKYNPIDEAETFDDISEAERFIETHRPRFDSLYLSIELMYVQYVD